MKKKPLALCVITFLALALASCGPSSTSTPVQLSPAVAETPPPASQNNPSFQLSSPAFQADQLIPVRHACHGENLSPPLTWSGTPPNVKSLELIMEDPDAVSVAGLVWDHWILFNIPAEVTSLVEGIPPDPEMPDGSRQGMTSFRSLGYGGPCPPGGQTHHYVFTLYALDAPITLEAGASKNDLLLAMEGHILAQTQLVGVYTSP